MANKISCCETVYGGWQQAIEYLPKAGVKYIELQAGKIDEVAKAAAACRAAGVTPLSIAGDVDACDNASIARVKEGCDLADEIGVRYYFLSAHGEDSDASMAALRLLGEHAAGRRVVLSLETHPPFCLNASEMQRTMAGVEHQNVRVNFDTANIMYYNEGADSVVELAKIVDSVASIHLKDTDGGFHSGNFPVFGEGVVDFPRIFATLHDAGFDGPLTMELEGPLMDGLDAAGTHEKVAACMDYLRSIGEA